MIETQRDIDIHLEITIDSARDAVFRAIAEQIDAWWDHRFFEHSTVTLEPWAGGRFYEHSDAGESLYATVQQVVRNEKIVLVGPMGMKIPCVNVMTLSLEDSKGGGTRGGRGGGGGTKLTLTHVGQGAYTDEIITGYTKGWSDLLEGRLKAFVEGKAMTD